MENSYSAFHMFDTVYLFSHAFALSCRSGTQPQSVVVQFYMFFAFPIHNQSKHLVCVCFIYLSRRFVFEPRVYLDAALFPFVEYQRDESRYTKQMEMATWFICYQNKIGKSQITLQIISVAFSTLYLQTTESFACGPSLA